ncbi:protein transport protein Sec16A-like [Diachasma alloeum]|nr:protein transport protein Sec16A-like [Diachasma alloeum]
MGPSPGKQYDPLKELDAIEPMNVKKPIEGKKVEKLSEKKSSAVSSGSWFGGLFSKLTPKPKNQMILPDDSNPTIVWDPVAKKWTNKDETSESGSSSLAPPPKAADMSLHQSRVESPNPLPPQPALNLLNREEVTTPNNSKIMNRSNMFKLQKGRGMRANYIDVMNPNASKGNIPSIPTPANSPLMPMAASSPQMFIPAPVNDPDAPLNFLTPTQASIPSQENNSHVNQQDTIKQRT